MNLKAFLFRIVLPVIVICLAAVAAFAFYWDRGWGHYSSFGPGVSKDQDLIAVFHAHQETFEKLQKMATEDAQQGRYFNSPDFEGSKLNGSRQQEYKDLVSKIIPGLTANIDYDSSMRFIFAGGGLSAIGPGWAKGIEYVPGSCETKGAVYANSVIKGIAYHQEGEGVASTNLDQAQALPANVYLRPIETNWFIFYQRTD